MFSLADNKGTPLTGAAINSGQVRVYSLREAKATTDPHLSFDKNSKYFTFSESAISPGVMLAFVTATDTMYVSVYGRTANRIIDGVQVQKGSYVLSSNDFAGSKVLKVDNWNKYLEDGEAPRQQDVSAYIAVLRTRKPVTLVDHNH